MWPVGLVGELLYERPVCLNGKVHSWFHYLFRNRKFPTDMAGFAVHLRLIHQHSSYVFNVSEHSIGQQESQILDRMTTIDQLECLASNASKVMLIKLCIEDNDILSDRSTFGIRRLSRCF